MKGPVRYISWFLDAPPDWAAPAEDPSGRDALDPQDAQRWHRMTEPAFSSWEAFKEGAIDEPPEWTPPPYCWPGSSRRRSSSETAHSTTSCARFQTFPEPRKQLRHAALPDVELCRRPWRQRLSC